MCGGGRKVYNSLLGFRVSSRESPGGRWVLGGAALVFCLIVRLVTPIW